MKTQNITPVSPESIGYLSQIAQLLSELSGVDDAQYAYADELYQKALSAMLAAAPSPLQKEWNKIMISRVRIGHENVTRRMNIVVRADSNNDELSAEEEELYRKALES